MMRALRFLEKVFELRQNSQKTQKIGGKRQKEHIFSTRYRRNNWHKPRMMLELFVFR